MARRTHLLNSRWTEIYGQTLSHMNATFDSLLRKIEYLLMLLVATMGLLHSAHSMCRSPFDPRGAQAKKETPSMIPFLPASLHHPAYFATRSGTDRTRDGKNGALSPHLLVRCWYSTVGQYETQGHVFDDEINAFSLKLRDFCTVIPSFKQTVFHPLFIRRG